MSDPTKDVLKQFGKGFAIGVTCMGIAWGCGALFVYRQWQNDKAYIKQNTEKEAEKESAKATQQGGKKGRAVSKNEPASIPLQGKAP